ncbi:MAG: ABC transporter permease [Actinomycetota bacterium]
MRDLQLALRQVRYENVAFWRNPAAAFFTFAFPLIFLVIFNLIFGSDTTDRFGEVVSLSNFYIPAVAAFSVITACYTNIAIGVTFARDEGQLKRIRGTPLPGWAYLFGRIAHAMLIALILVVIVVLFGRVLYDVDIPGKTMPAFVASVAAGAAVFAALGLAVTAIIPNPDASPAVTNATILPLLFVSDVFIPLGPDTPKWLGTFADIFPIKHFSHALITAYNPSGTTTGSGFVASDLIVMAFWGVFGVAAAARFFSWEPRT